MIPFRRQFLQIPCARIPEPGCIPQTGSSGYEIPSVPRVSGQLGMAGGGFEMQFPYAIPPEFIRVVQR